MTQGTRPLELLTSYVPDLVMERLCSNEASIGTPSLHAFDAAVVLCDISGFTALTERLTQGGREGTEQLTRILNARFGALIDHVYSHGGDIVKFAGDALLAVWPSREGGEQAATQQAAHCALGMHALLNREQTHVPLFLRVGIGVGRLKLAYVGGLDGRWDVLVTGEMLARMGAVFHQAIPGHTVLTEKAWQAVGEWAVGVPLREGGVRLESIAPTPSEASRPGPVVTDRVLAALRSMLPIAVHTRMVSHRTEWLAELRPITALFVNLPELSAEMPIERIQAIVLALQTAVNRYEGSINKFSVDEKGVTVVVALGLPPHAHEDDAVRGLHVAFAVQEALSALGQLSAIGVTTGRAFCGEIGNRRRREYTIIGDTVNLAARLMQHASGSILCDAATQQLAKSKLDFEELPALKLKGKSGSIPVFRPLQLAQRKTLNRDRIVGRAAERGALASGLSELLSGGFRFIVVEAEAGLGKSRLVADLLERAQALGIEPLVGAADAIEKATPYYSWRAVFSHVFGLEGAHGDAAERRALVAARLLELLPAVGGTTASALLPLLNPLLGLDFPETPATKRMTASVRIDHTHQLLTSVLAAVAGRAPLLLVIEDAHWLDSSSWQLARKVAVEVRPIYLVLATRPLSDPIPADFTAIVALPGCTRLGLAYLSVDETLSLICQRLGVARLPSEVSELIHDRAEGHPFFSEELAYSLRDSGLLRITAGECVLSSDAPDFRTLDLPSTIEGVITSRIDRLSSSEQLAMKVASVIGRIFALRTLQDVFPISEDRSLLADHLKVLERLDLTPLDVPDPELTYIFKHIITQEVVYNLMLFSQRKPLHSAVAEWYERAYAPNLAPYYALLAHHWSKAEDPVRALEYLEKAGDLAIQTGAYLEAIRFFDQAIATGEKVPAIRRARWERQMGHAYLSLNQILAGRQHLYQSLDLLGYPMPKHPAAVIVGLTAEINRQAAHRLFPKQVTGKSTTPELQATMIELGHIYQDLFEIYFFTHEPILMTYAIVRSVNCSERLPPSAQLAWSFACMSMLCGAAKIAPWALAYERMARAVPLSDQEVSTKAGLMLRLATYRLLSAQWSQLEAIGSEGLPIAEQLGDRRRIAELLAIVGNGVTYRGEIERGGAMFARIHQMPERDNDVQFTCWGSSGVATMHFRLGRLDEAMRLLESVRPAFEQTVDGILKVIYYGHLASGYLRQGEAAKAWENALIAQTMLSHIPTSWMLEAYFGVIEVCVAFLAADPASLPVPRRELEQVAKKAYGMTRAVARMFPAAEPQARMWQGLYLCRTGKRAAGLRRLRQSVELAVRCEMPYEEGLARHALATWLPSGESQRRLHLETAKQLFAHLGASDRLVAVEGDLALLSP